MCCTAGGVRFGRDQATCFRATASRVCSLRRNTCEKWECMKLRRPDRIDRGGSKPAQCGF